MSVQDMAMRASPRRRRVSLWSGLLVSLAVSSAAGLARAQETRETNEAKNEVPGDRTVTAAAEPGRFLPGALAPEAGAARAVGFGWAGYDGATGTAIMGATTEVRLGARVVLGASAVRAPGNDLRAAGVRPSVVARVQVLDQRRHGLDMGLALAYREDRFTGEEGFFQGTVMLGARGALGTVLANLAYGQDGEGDDHEGELRLAALARLTTNLNLGIDGHVRRSLDSTDPRRLAHGSPSLEYVVGPTLAYGLGTWGLTVQGGWSGARLDRYQSGVVALGGLGTLF
jgi:hypothetical protein